MSITYKKINDKYVFTKDGINFALTAAQREELIEILNDIKLSEIEALLDHTLANRNPQLITK